MDISKYAQILPHGSAVMTMGDSNKSVLASSIDRTISSTNFEQPTEKLFTEIIKKGEHQGFTIPRIEISGQKEILLREKIIENNRKQFETLSPEKKGDVQKKIAFREMIDQIYYESDDLELNKLGAILQEGPLKNLEPAKDIIKQINDKSVGPEQKIFQINVHLRNLDNEVNQQNPELINIAHSMSNNFDIDKSTQIYPYEEGHELIKLNNEIYHSRQDPKELLDHFFEKIIQPKLLESLKKNPNSAEGRDFGELLNEVKEGLAPIRDNPEKHKIIPEIIDNFYPEDENGMIEQIRSKCEQQKTISPLDPDIIKYYGLGDKSKILANNV